MKVSSKGRYGLRCMVDLAINARGEHVALNQIAERQGISQLYLEQVFSALRKGGLVKSVKGAGGGYTLAKAASDISVGDILRALEGDLSVAKAIGEDNKQPSSYERSLERHVWSPVDAAIHEVIDQLTLERLAQETQREMGGEDLMWFI